MGGTRSLSTTCALLPSASTTKAQPSAEPMASPSGRACELSTKVPRSSIALSTFSTMRVARTPSSAIGKKLSSLLDPLQQLFHPSCVLLPIVEETEKFGHTPQSQPIQPL